MATQEMSVDESSVGHERAQCLTQMIERACNLLPVPGPITAFAFLNTLQALEDLPFEEGILKGARLYGAQPYLTERNYRDKLSQGRIDADDLTSVLKERLSATDDADFCGLTSRFELRLAMLRYEIQSGPPAELRWFIAETDALRRIRREVPIEARTRLIEETQHWIMRDLRGASTKTKAESTLLADLMERFDGSRIEHWSDDRWESVSLQALWRICCEGVNQVDISACEMPKLVRPRDVLLEATRRDSDLLVHELLVRFCAAFTDQGFASWSLPDQGLGFYRSFFRLYGDSTSLPDRWLRALPAELKQLEAAGRTPTESILESLDLLGIVETNREEFLTATLLALRGWAGMIHQMEIRGDRVPVPVPAGTLIEFLAVRLILDRIALGYLGQEALGYTGPLSGLRTASQTSSARRSGPSLEQRAFVVFQLAQILGWSPATLHRRSQEQWSVLVTEIEAFGSLERRRYLHAAFERHCHVQILDAISIFAQCKPERVQAPRFQSSYCLDAREESFRRHLEEIAPDVETYAVAGFYGIAMYYRGLADAHFAALCPVIIRPQTWVIEETIYTLEEVNQRRAKARRAIGTASHHVHLGSRNLAWGAVLATGLGVLASIPLVARVLFPRLTARVKRSAEGLIEPPPISRLRLERSTATAGPETEAIGYSLEEMANIGERQLRDMGLTTNFAKLVFFFGHGSFCLNNPHKSAYDCGACSGTPGGPNGRALATMLNDERVRGILAIRGLSIPLTTHFVGGLHNTGNDSITYYDLDLLPHSHLRDFEAAKATLEEACERNAHERCRRFESAPLDISLEAAHRHVEDRCEDLAQTRPEYGNATNASCFVGRRERVRGLFMDRRCFLTSYDPTQDDFEHTILARILGAAVPVCEGINLQYYFSYVDPTGWACGTKLPHNVASLLGVMDGAASDLRPGLPWQSVEIHEPVRLLFIVEATPETMVSIMDRNPVIGRILRNNWAKLAVLDPDSAEIRMFRDNEFQLYEPTSKALPEVSSSIAWYRGWRDHLGFARIFG